MSTVKRVTFIEIALKKCQLTHPSAPLSEFGVYCAATGEPCFNSRATCQDLQNLLELDEIVRFAKPSSNIDRDIECIENISSISYEPAKLDLGKSIGIRSSLRVSFKDHRSPDTDNSGDPYIFARDYSPYERGTYWGKFRARHPFIRGQSIWLIQGTSDQSLESMTRRRFVIESSSGPDANGNYNIVAKDVLKLAQGDRAQAPVVSLGYLQSDITDSQTSFNISPSGAADFYPSSGKAAIGGKELVSFTRSGSTMTVVRGINNTQAASHKSQSRIQLALEYIAKRPSEIFYDLLTNYTNVTPDLIPLADWNNESDTQLGRVYNAIIAQPTPVVQLINELLEQTASTMWWDEEAELLRWSVLKKPSSDAFEYNDDYIQAGTFNISDQPEKRISQVWLYYGQINPLLNLDEKNNYASSIATVDAESEQAYGQPAYKEIFSRWILSDARDTAQTIANIILQRYSTPPRKLGFKILQNSMPVDPKLASSYKLVNEFIQDETGAKLPIPFQVTSITPGDSSLVIQGEEITFAEIEAVDPDLIDLYPSDGTLNYNVYDAYVSQVGRAPSASAVVNVYVENGFKIGSTSTSIASLTVDSRWPVGSAVSITNNGSIIGRGGNGGNGGGSSVSFSSASTAITAQPTSGSNGGDAIRIEAGATVSLTNNGTIGGGGGGGAGARSATISVRAEYFPGFFIYTGAAVSGSGGGGGAGYPAGSGGAAGSWSNSYSSYDRPAAGGNSGSLTAGGSARTNAYDRATKDENLRELDCIASASGAGSFGGALGVNGQQSLSTSTTATKGQVTRTRQSESRSGGLAGKAISGSTANLSIIQTGLIYGSID